jgi:hypothetical protein
MKHNKKRNTAFIYETLARELTKAIVEKDHNRKDAVLKVIKEFFSEGSILHEELELYNTLLETSNIQYKLAERLLDETKTSYSRLEEAQIFDAQSKIIAAINRNLGQDVWANFVPNFKSLASLNIIFSPKTSVKKRVLFEQAIIDRMSEKAAAPAIMDMRPLDSLTYSSFIKKFNDKYGSLLQEQKDLLNRYVTSYGDNGFELRVYLNEEVGRLKMLLEETTINVVEALVAQKAQKVVTYLDSFRHRDFTPDDLNRVLKTQALVRELVAND